MPDSQPSRRVVERIILVLALALFLFATPFIYGWARDNSPWYLPYLLWVAVIALTAWNYYRSRDHGV